MATTTPDSQTNSTSSTRVVDRRVVSEPNRVIQVERVTVTREQQSSVTTAINTGRKTGDK